MSLRLGFECRSLAPHIQDEYSESFAMVILLVYSECKPQKQCNWRGKYVLLKSGNTRGANFPDFL